VPLPIFIDRHDLKGTTAAEVAKAHLHDLEIQDAHGVKYLTYWFDEERGTAFCLVDAPDREAAERVHREAHGQVANTIIEVDPATVEAFLGRLSDRDVSKPDPAFRAIMFTDIVGSTEMILQLGDRRAVEVVRAHDSLVRRCLSQFNGREVKQTGDGIMASFDEAPNAVGCAKAIQIAVAAFNATSRYPFRVRIGVNAGEPIEDSRDLFGSTVHFAARLCEAAEPEEIFVSSLVAAAFGPSELFTDHRVMVLKGFSDAQTVHAVKWR
jgi:class 3 adenylate cyclase